MQNQTGTLLVAFAVSCLSVTPVWGQVASDESTSASHSLHQSGKSVDEMAYASVRIDGGKTRELIPDLTGSLPSMRIPVEAKLSIKMIYPHGKPGEEVRIEAEEVAKSHGEQIVALGKLDARRSLSFQVETTPSRLHARHKWDSTPLHFRFRTTHGSNLIRIILQKGNDEKILLLWTNPPTE